MLVRALLDDAAVGDVAVSRALATRYLAFVNHAFDPTLGRFRNFMSYERAWLEAAGSEDCHARAIWALGTVVGRARSPSRQSLVGGLFHAALPAARAFTSPRAWAFTLLGIDEYLGAFQGDVEIEATRGELARRLHAALPPASDAAWPWFEQYLTYENARLPQALIVSAARMMSNSGVQNDSACESQPSANCGSSPASSVPCSLSKATSSGTIACPCQPAGPG